jgi:hypothetical protein
VENQEKIKYAETYGNKMFLNRFNLFFQCFSQRTEK